MSLALGAVWSMRSVHERLEALTTQDAVLSEQANLLGAAVSEVELQLYALQVGRQRHLDDLIDAVEHMRRRVEQLAGPDAPEAAATLPAQAAQFERHVTALAATRDPALVEHHHSACLAAARELRSRIFQINEQVHTQMQSRLATLTGQFRWLVVGIAAGFLVVINGSILLLLRSAGMVLRPVERLVDASRQLAAERFDHRVDLPGQDEFQELAKAFNQLAAQLQNNEQRKLEVMHQVAATLNHELNNAAAIIELQLRLLRRQAGSGNNMEKPLEQIHASLQRMTAVVTSLKHVRRIVLTDYLHGVRMLDLERSVEPDAAPPSSNTPGAAPGPAPGPALDPDAGPAREPSASVEDRS